LQRAREGRQHAVLQHAPSWHVLRRPWRILLRGALPAAGPQQPEAPGKVDGLDLASGNGRPGPGGCFLGTLQAAADAGVGLIVQVKENQPTLHRQARRICANTTPQDHAISHNIGRNRDETRTVDVFDPKDAITDPEWRACIAAVIKVERRVYIRDAKTGLLTLATHTACYLANSLVTAGQAADAIRGHWTIENTSHCSRGVTMGEDASRIRSNPGVFARLRSFAYNILKANKIGTLSQDRYRAALGGVTTLLQMVSKIER